jgi:hypothetical protein
LRQRVSPQESFQVFPHIGADSRFLLVTRRMSSSYQKALKLSDVRWIAEKKKRHLVPALGMSVIEVLVKPSRQVGRLTCIVKAAITPVQSVEPTTIIGLLQELQEGWTLFTFEQSPFDPV